MVYVKICCMFEIICRLYVLQKTSCVFLVPSFRPWVYKVCGNEYFENLGRVKKSTEKGSGKQMLLKCREILKDYKSERSPLKMLKVHGLVTLQALNLKLCQKLNSTTSIFQWIRPPFNNTYFKENFKEKSNDFEMQYIVCYSGVLFFIFSCCNLYV